MNDTNTKPVDNMWDENSQGDDVVALTNEADNLNMLRG